MQQKNPTTTCNWYKFIKIYHYPEEAVVTSSPGLGNSHKLSLGLELLQLRYSVRVDVRITAMHLSFKTGRATFAASGS